MVVICLHGWCFHAKIYLLNFCFCIVYIEQPCDIEKEGRKGCVERNS